jgi:cellulose biosynthesis protein BcsQ
MSQFDQVLDKTVSVVESQPYASDLEAVTVIRDLKGLVRLVLEFKKDASGRDLAPVDWDKKARKAIEEQLANALAPYWGGRVWRKGERADAAYRALEMTIENSRLAWPDAPSKTPGAPQWFKLERLFSKSSWFSGGVKPPWSLDDPNNPAIISFYSFKGGVGRTTALAATALHLARAERTVVVLDLDLEAPGAGSLLLGDITPPDDGIVDYLLEIELSGKRPPTLLPYVTAQSGSELIASGRPIRVLSAGRLNRAFVEKIARLDFESYLSKGRNPLVELLDHVRTEYAPDFVLLDVRSGLHDLGGLSLNGLSHLDVIFGLDTEQSWAGIAIVLALLGAAEPRREVLLAHAMVTPARFDPEANQRFRLRSFDLFREHYYGEDEDMPDIVDTNAPYGLAIPYQEELLNVGNIGSVAELLARTDGPYARLVQAIGAYVQRDTI